MFRKLRNLTLGALALAAFALPLQAQDNWPDKPINLVVSFPAGGNADIISRLNADALSKELGVPVNVVNIPGGAMIPAVMNVKEAAADGYTILRWTAPSFVIGPLVRDTPYDPLTDFVPLFSDETIANALYVAADSDIQTFEDFLAKARSEKLTMGVNNIGAPPHLSAVQLSKEFGLEFNVLTMKTVPASLLGLVGGQVDVAVGQVGSLKAMGDEIRAIAILDNNRLDYFESDLPGVKTIGELAEGKQASTWISGGLAVRAGTPQAVIDKLIAASEAALTTPEHIAASSNVAPYHWIVGVEDTSAWIQSGIDLYKPMLDELGLLKR